MDSTQIQADARTGDGVRPYRSHKFPACDRCRKLKTRCVFESDGEACQLCQRRQRECVWINLDSGVKRSFTIPRDVSAPAPARKRAKPNSSAPHTRPTNVSHSPLNSLLNRGNLSNQDTPGIVAENRNEDRPDEENQSSVIVGPATAEDIRIVTQHISVQSPPGSRKQTRFDTLLDHPKDPVLYLQVPRHRRGLLPYKTRPGQGQREILEQILGPLASELIEVYFRQIHPSFPVLDEENFRNLLHSQDHNLSSPLVCDVLAITLVYWNRSEVLSKHHKPDVHYVWNLAVTALQEDFLAPGISTICAAMLDLAGRPTTAIIGNTINCGRTVALANSLGLNRNPETWKLGQREKALRIRLWWGTLIHDRWSSFAHGIPGNLSKHQYNVPVPSLDMILTDGVDNPARESAAGCFIALCELTEILGDILPLVYDMRERKRSQLDKLIRRLEVEIDDWEESDHVQKTIGYDATPVSGGSSLKLGLLSIKMLLHRIGLFAATNTTDPSLPEAEDYSRAVLRESARSIADYLCSLRADHLEEFWLPYTAYHIASAVIVLLRAVVDNKDTIASETCRLTLSNLRLWLSHASKAGWDLADLCLSQFGEYMEELGRKGLAESLDESGLVVEGAVETQSSEIGGSNLSFDVRDWADELGYPFVDLWDMFPWENAGANNN